MSRQFIANQQMTTRHREKQPQPRVNLTDGRTHSANRILPPVKKIEQNSLLKITMNQSDISLINTGQIAGSEFSLAGKLIKMEAHPSPAPNAGYYKGQGMQNYQRGNQDRVASTKESVFQVVYPSKLTISGSPDLKPCSSSIITSSLNPEYSSASPNQKRLKSSPATAIVLNEIPEPRGNFFVSDPMQPPFGGSFHSREMGQRMVKSDAIDFNLAQGTVTGGDQVKLQSNQWKIKAKNFDQQNSFIIGSKKINKQANPETDDDEEDSIDLQDLVERAAQDSQEEDDDDDQSSYQEGQESEISEEDEINERDEDSLEEIVEKESHNLNTSEIGGHSSPMAPSTKPRTTPPSNPLSMASTTSGSSSNTAFSQITSITAIGSNNQGKSPKSRTSGGATTMTGLKVFRIGKAKTMSSSPVKRKKRIDKGLSFGKIEERKEEDVDALSTHRGDASRIQPPPLYTAQQLFGRKKVPNTVEKPHNEEILMQESVYQGRPSTVFFPYPKYCQIVRKEHRVTKLSQDEYMRYNFSFKVSKSTHVYNSVVNSLKRAGSRIIPTNAAGWNVLWTGAVSDSTVSNATQYQRINHFPGCLQIGRKDCMYRNVAKMRRSFGLEYEICPQTYIFPEDYKRFIQDKDNTESSKTMWIMKPSASSCGRGIKVINKNSKVRKRNGYLVSKYVGKPHLINGFKYDLRLYVVVTSFDPLKIYLYKEGLVRFATQPYTNSSKSMKKRFIHLTNYSVNKKSDQYQANQNTTQQDSSKWSLKQLKDHFRDEDGVDPALVFGRIKDVLIKTLISIEPHIVNHMNRCTKFKNVCFELYGFDILIDANFKPWLLEVNISPSLSSSSPFDKQIKTLLLCDTFNLVGIVPYDKKKFDKEQERNNKKRLQGLQKGQYHLHQRITGGGFKPQAKTVNDIKKLNGNVNALISNLAPEAVNVLVEYDEEYYRQVMIAYDVRRGHFERIFPLSSNVNTYEKYFECPRYNNEILWTILKSNTIISSILSKYNYKKVANAMACDTFDNRVNDKLPQIGGNSSILQQ